MLQAIPHTSTQSPNLKVDGPSVSTLGTARDWGELALLLFLLRAGPLAFQTHGEQSQPRTVGFFLGMFPRTAVRKVAHLVPWSGWKDSCDLTPCCSRLDHRVLARGGHSCLLSCLLSGSWQGYVPTMGSDLTLSHTLASRNLLPRENGRCWEEGGSRLE